jgi:hypothetical protein
MPVLMLTLETLERLGASYPALQQATLSPEARRALEPLLVSRGFDVTRPVRVLELASGEGFVLSQ